MTAPPATTALEADIVVSVYRHRLLSTTQVHLLHTPGTTLRWTRKVLTGLEARGYLARTTQRRSRGVTSAQSLWYVTDVGADAAETSDVTTRRYKMTPARAAGPLQAHTLACNDTGVAFVDWARRLGHECSPADWEHEIAFRVAERPAAGPGSDLLVVDAVLHYAVRYPDGDELLTRFVEIDRGTETIQRLATKLRTYAALYLYAPKPGRDNSPHRPAGWRSQFLAFPKVLVVLAGRPGQLRRRRQNLIELCQLDPLLERLVGQVTVSVTTLDDLQDSGPFAPIFWQPFADQPVDLVGDDADGNPATPPGADVDLGDDQQLELLAGGGQ